MSFECNFNVDVLAQMIPHNKECEEWFYYLEQIIPDYGITTAPRVAAFMAQCSHESGQFTILQENLNYSDVGLQRIFPKYFPTPESTVGYARQPQKIASVVYANRMGNGPESSGDGWNYRGRGVIQITGRSNYLQCSMDLYGTNELELNPGRLLDKDAAIYSACWFWYRHDLNTLADAGDIVTMTKKINGGTNGLSERTANFQYFLQLLSQ